MTEKGLLPGCGAVHAPTEFAGFGVLSLLGMPVTGGSRTKPPATTTRRHRLRLDRIRLRRHPDLA